MHPLRQRSPHPVTLVSCFHAHLSAPNVSRVLALGLSGHSGLSGFSGHAGGVASGLRALRQHGCFEGKADCAGGHADWGPPRRLGRLGLRTLDTLCSASEDRCVCGWTWTWLWVGGRVGVRGQMQRTRCASRVRSRTPSPPLPLTLTSSLTSLETLPPVLASSQPLLLPSFVTSVL